MPKKKATKKKPNYPSNSYIGIRRVEGGWQVEKVDWVDGEPVFTKLKDPCGLRLATACAKTELDKVKYER